MLTKMFCVWILKPLDRIFHFKTWMGENEVIGDGGDQLTIETLKELEKNLLQKKSPAFCKTEGDANLVSSFS